MRRGVVTSSLSLLLLHLIHVSSSQEAFDKAPSPEPLYVREGEDGPTLECTLASAYRDKPYEVEWIRYTKDRPRTLTRNAKLLEKTHFELFNDAASGIHNLKIKEVTRNDTAGKYHCTVLNTDDGTQHTTRGTEVVVLVPPGDPVIVSAPKDTIIEGEGITFKCSSTGGSPSPSFSWLFQNDTQAPLELHTQQTDGETVYSTIHWRATAEDNGAFVTCAVTNLALTEGEKKKAMSPRLNVLYKPRVSVGPVSEYAVEAGEPVTLTCNADANPSQPSYQWTHLASNQHYASSSWPFVAEKGLTGAYECRVRNTVGESAETLQLQVQYAPVVTVEPVVNPAEGEDVVVECTVDAFPSEEAIEWTGPNGFVSRGSTLSLRSVNRDQSGNYTCTATNYLNLYGVTGSQPRTGTAKTLVDVKRRPGRGVVKPWTLSVMVGETIELACEAADVGSPSASYKWASPSSGGAYGTKEHTRNTLVIRDAQLADNGEYRCVPYNNIGEGEAGIARVVVIEPATITLPMTTERVYAEGEEKQELTCEARGYPLPEITWTKDEQPLASLESWTVENVPAQTSCSPSDFCSVAVTSTLRWTRPIAWSDKGNYSCIASNGASEASSTWTLARVTHGPVVLNEKYPDEAFAAADIGKTAIISCRVSARPRPEFTWLYDSKEIKEGGRYSFQVNQELYKPDEYESILYVSDVTEADYGRYLCRSVNGKGEKAEVIIRLKEMSPPQVPDQLQQLSATHNSIIVAWRPGFDGGFNQNFILEYRQLNPFTESVANSQVFTIDVKNSTLRRVMFNKNSNRPRRSPVHESIVNLVTFNLTDLRPLSTYYVSVRANNTKGQSEFCKYVTVSTADVPISRDLPAPMTIDYVAADGTFSVQPATPSEQCLMFYVSNGDTWRAVDCYSGNRTAVVEDGGDRFKARFCRMSPSEEILDCSEESRILVASMLSPPYRLSLLLPIALASFAVLIACAFLIICCRFKSGSKAKRPIHTVIAKGGLKAKKMVTGERPEVSGPLSSLDSKNAPKNGSATDSGVFTLDSANIATKSPTKLYGSDRSANYSSRETGVDVWPTGDEGTLHGYGGETSNYPGGGPAYYDTQPDHGHNNTSSYDEDDTEEAYSSGGRRVLREIIV